MPSAHIDKSVAAQESEAQGGIATCTFNDSDGAGDVTVDSAPSLDGTRRGPLYSGGLPGGWGGVRAESRAESGAASDSTQTPGQQCRSGHNT